MSKPLLGIAVAALAASSACSDDKPATKEPPKKVEGQASAGFVGVDPSIFECDALLPVADVGKAVGGAVEPMPPMFDPPAGTPQPCDYRQTDVDDVEVLDGAPAPAQRMWSIRFDCRESYLPTTTKEMERLVASEGATRAEVGKWGADHRNAALVFLDDDAPCSVRVVGPGADVRLAIGRLVADRLTPKTAPMTPRPAP